MSHFEYYKYFYVSVTLCPGICAMGVVVAELTAQFFYSDTTVNIANLMKIC